MRLKELIKQFTDHKEIIALNYKEVVDWWNAPYREGDNDAEY